MTRNREHKQITPAIILANVIGFLRSVLLFLAVGVAVSTPVKAQEFRLMTSPWPPSNFLDQSGQPTGISVAIINALKGQLGVSTAIEVVPWARAYKIAKTEPNILLFTAAKTTEREEQGFEFLGPAVMWTHSLLARRDSNLEIVDLEDAKQQGLTAVGVRGSWQMQLLNEAGIQTVETADHGTSARMLLAGRVDLWITSRLQASVVLNGIGAPQSATQSLFTIRKSPSYLMISEGSDTQLLDKWRSALEELKKGEHFHAIAKDWSKKLGISIIYRPEEGFSADIMAKGSTG